MRDTDPACTAVIEQLPLFVGGDLEDDQAARVRGHLEGCPACTEAFVKASAACAALGEALWRASRPPERPQLWPGVRAGLVDAGVLPADGAGRPDGLPAEPGPLVHSDRPAKAWGRRALFAAAAALLGIALLPGLLERFGPGAGGTVVPIVAPLVVGDVAEIGEVPTGVPGPIEGEAGGLRRVQAGEDSLSESVEYLRYRKTQPKAAEGAETLVRDRVLRGIR